MLTAAAVVRPARVLTTTTPVVRPARVLTAVMVLVWLLSRRSTGRDQREY
jgi:hypothetical protein